MRAHWFLPKRTARTSKQTLTEFRLSLQAEKGTNRAMFRRGGDFGDPLGRVLPRRLAPRPVDTPPSRARRHPGSAPGNPTSPATPEWTIGFTVGAHVKT